MPLASGDFSAILGGFLSRYQLLERQTELSNPIKLQIPVNGKKQNFRLWCFEITHGGGGPQVRAKNEYRVQVTKGPISLDEFDQGATEILLGYSRDQNVIVVYDRRWLHHYASKKQENPESRFSPSVQVKTEQIEQGMIQGVFSFEKRTQIFGYADIITLIPEKLPDFLANYQQYLRY